MVDHVVRERRGGADETRTRDPLLAKQMLYQLSYSPTQIFRAEKRYR